MALWHYMVDCRSLKDLLLFISSDLMSQPRNTKAWQDYIAQPEQLMRSSLQKETQKILCAIVSIIFGATKNRQLVDQMLVDLWLEIAFGTFQHHAMCALQVVLLSTDSGQIAMHHSHPLQRSSQDAVSINEVETIQCHFYSAIVQFMWDEGCNTGHSMFYSIVSNLQTGEH